MATAVEICNMALRAIGETRITALSDENELARLCNEMYAVSRDAVLRAHPWRCAVTRGSLSQLVAAPAFGYDHMYQVPTDCLRVLAVYDSGGVELNAAGDWARENYNDGAASYQVIVSNADSLYVKYIRSETDTAQFDSLLTMAIAARLAADIAERIPKTDAVTQMAWKLYAAKLAEAKFADSTEAAPPETWASTWEYEKF